MRGSLSTQHRFEAGELAEECWLRRMQRLRRSLNRLLKQGTKVICKRYAGRCEFLLKHEQSLWTFTRHKGTALTNNEAERCLRGSVIMRKISFGTSSDRGDKFRSRIASVVETCKKRGLEPLEVVSNIVTAVVTKQPYPDVFSLAKN